MMLQSGRGLLWRPRPALAVVLLLFQELPLIAHFSVLDLPVWASFGVVGLLSIASLPRRRRSLVYSLSLGVGRNLRLVIVRPGGLLAVLVAATSSLLMVRLAVTTILDNDLRLPLRLALVATALLAVALLSDSAAASVSRMGLCLLTAARLVLGRLLAR